ncbi:hypothetical protein KY495_20110 [Massilia sp. PAMC28688]|uniref:PKD domain-containing protein n=1 Tax=Massilia sp. PAMC28688 TaxID=2861283 RepID=UPI001C62F587|nr:PKD domain-containing protein [Massilia sp. PAMC28688]QYF92986.1 hypothetical protein KY495_20110 [Massilia sp. PAMC28688]
MNTNNKKRARQALTGRSVLACMGCMLAACGGGSGVPAADGPAGKAPLAAAAAPASVPGWPDGTAVTDIGFAASHQPRPAVAAVVAGSAVQAMHAAGAPRYAIINLGPGLYAGLTDINNKDQVVMSLENAAGYRSYFFNGQTVRDIGTLGGPYAFASSLNDAGQVTGSASYAGAEFSRAFLWSETAGMRDLGVIGGSSSYGSDINEYGLVAGYSTTQAGDQFTRHAFGWRAAGGMRDLGVLPGAATSTGLAVNDSGMVVGYSDSTAFAWTSATGMQAIGPDAEATLVNDQGQVAGAMALSQTTGRRAFVWNRDTGLLDIGTLGGAQTEVAAMNAGGQVVGFSFTGDPGGGAIHAMSWTRSGGMRDLGTLGGGFSTAQAVNDNGIVVGQSLYRNDIEQEHAFVWSPAAGMLDLNRHLVRAPAGLELYGALAISNLGAIVANSNAGLVLLKPGLVGTSAPVIGPITSSEPVRPGRAVTFAASFTDHNTSEHHRATWYWGGGCRSGPGTITQANGSGRVTGVHVWCRAGTYWVTLTVTDSGGRRSTVARKVTVGAAAKVRHH